MKSHPLILLKGYRPCRRPLSVHERDLHREGTSTIRSMSLRVRRKMKHEKTHPTDAGTQTYPGLNTYVPIVKSASRAQLEMETCRSEAIVANNFVSGMVSWFAATLTLALRAAPRSNLHALGDASGSSTKDRTEKHARPCNGT